MRTSFNENWVVQPKVSIFSRLNDQPDDRVRVTLPHDAMLLVTSDSLPTSTARLRIRPMPEVGTAGAAGCWGAVA